MKKKEYEEFMKYLAEELIRMTIMRNLDTIKKTIKKSAVEKTLKHKLDKEYNIEFAITVDSGALRLLYTQFEAKGKKCFKRCLELKPDEYLITGEHPNAVDYRVYYKDKDVTPSVTGIIRTSIEPNSEVSS